MPSDLMPASLGSAHAYLWACLDPQHHEVKQNTNCSRCHMAHSEGDHLLQLTRVADDVFVHNNSVFLEDSNAGAASKCEVTQLIAFLVAAACLCCEQDTSNLQSGSWVLTVSIVAICAMSYTA